MDKPMHIDVELFESVMGSIGLTKKELARKSELHTNTVSKVLRMFEGYHATTGLDTLNAMVKGLNAALVEKGKQPYNPIDFIVTDGFPPPHMDAPIPEIGSLVPA